MRLVRLGRPFGRICAALLLATSAGCAIARVPRDRTCTVEGAVATPVEIVVHTINRHHARVTAPDIVAIANERLAPANIELRIAETRIHADLPAAHLGQALDPWVVPGAVNVFIFLVVESETAEGPAEVQGRYLGNGVIVVSGNRGTWDTLAHEVGHMLGLRHVSDPANVMGEDRVWGSRFSEAQAGTMRRKVSALQRGPSPLQAMR